MIILLLLSYIFNRIYIDCSFVADIHLPIVKWWVTLDLIGNNHKYCLTTINVTSMTCLVYVLRIRYFLLFDKNYDLHFG